MASKSDTIIAIRQTTIADCTQEIDALITLRLKSGWMKRRKIDKDIHYWLRAWERIASLHE